MSNAGTWAAVAGLVLLTAAGLRFYLPLAREVFVLRRGLVGTDWVRWSDAAVAILLGAWLVSLGRDALLSSGERSIEFRSLVTGALVYGAVVLFLLGGFIYRDLSPMRVFGLATSPFFRALGQALLALVAAYPVLMLVQSMVYGVSGGDPSMQDVVRFLQESQSPRDRWAVLLMAVVVAPVAEEIIFRGFLYPVGKKFGGAFVSALLTSLLFAALHGHAPSVPALCTLALCLVLAYEKSGSLLVPMIMHAVFNAISVSAILLLA
ncbi:MAG: CPBP family intramembrane metalloprotease [Chthoniobacterales bacterium]|nr:CPBP family intramembrane metalloprotease [Chthoniobacterales bacterium]